MTYSVTLHLKFQPPSQDEKIFIVSIISNLFDLTLQSTFSPRDGFLPARRHEYNNIIIFWLLASFLSQGKFPNKKKLMERS